MRNDWWRYALSAILVGVALLSGGKAFYLSSKAWLAQTLLHQAWQASEQAGEQVKPWPWADIHPRGLLEVPALGIRQIVLNDHSGESLAFGPGLAEANEAVVLAGHRDSHFAFVEDLMVGDEINWQRSGASRRAYRVSAMHVLDTRKQEQIMVPDHTLVLITCYPFDALQAGGPLRYVVEAQPVIRL